MNWRERWNGRARPDGAGGRARLEQAARVREADGWSMVAAEQEITAAELVTPELAEKQVSCTS